jgi:lambda family phage minor tail protein L
MPMGEPQLPRAINMRDTAKNTKTLFELNPSVVICLYKIDLKERGSYLFHAGENGYRQKLVFNAKEYDYFPVKAEGFEMHGDGKLPRPKLTFSNHQGVISLRLNSFKDFINYKVTRIKTFVKYLDDINFPDNVNPHAEADPEAAFSEDVFYVNQKTREDDNVVEFELVSLLELQNADVPARTIYSNSCSWVYRGKIGCGYQGKPIADVKNKRFVDSGYHNKSNMGRVGDTSMVGSEVYFSGDFLSTEFAPQNAQGSYPEWAATGVYKKGDAVAISPFETDGGCSPVDVYVCLENNAGSNPAYNQEEWALDQCSRTLCGCRLRFANSATGAGGGKRMTTQTTSSSNTWIEGMNGLPFGGFPGVDPYEFK